MALTVVHAWFSSVYLSALVGAAGAYLWIDTLFVLVRHALQARARAASCMTIVFMLSQRGMGASAIVARVRMRFLRQWVGHRMRC